MNEPLSRYNMTVTVEGDGGHLPDPAKFAAAADQAAWAGPRTSSARTSPKIISVITVLPQTGTQPWSSPRLSYPTRSNARPCHPVSQKTTAPSIIPSPRPDREQPSACRPFVV